MGGPPPPIAPAGGPAPKKGRGPLFWIASGCCGCLLLALVFGGGCALFFWKMRNEHVGVVRGQIQEIKSGRMDAAYERLSEAYRGRVSASAFQAFVARHPGLTDNTDSTFPMWNQRNNTVSLAGVLTTASGATEAASYELVKEGGAWKIAEMQVGGEGP